MISIVDYGMGNLRSVQKGFERVGASAQIISTPAEIDRAGKLVLPGVGAFGDAANTLRDRGLVEPLLNFISRDQPFLGICLGLHLLFDVSYEYGEHTGLGVIRGKVVPFERDRISTSAQLKIPHMGWNRITWQNDIPIFSGIDQQSYFYFVHSYYVVPLDKSVKTAWTNYGIDFVSAVSKGNLFAVQFHPEKSQQVGLKVLENFARL